MVVSLASARVVDRPSVASRASSFARVVSPPTARRAIDDAPTTDARDCVTPPNRCHEIARSRIFARRRSASSVDRASPSVVVPIGRRPRASFGWTRPAFGYLYLTGRVTCDTVHDHSSMIHPTFYFYVTYTYRDTHKK